MGPWGFLVLIIVDNPKSTTIVWNYYGSIVLCLKYCEVIYIEHHIWQLLNYIKKYVRYCFIFRVIITDIIYLFTSIFYYRTLTYLLYCQNIYIKLDLFTVVYGDSVAINAPIAWVSVPTRPVLARAVGDPMEIRLNYQLLKKSFSIAVCLIALYRYLDNNQQCKHII